MNTDNVLFLTACVNPNGMSYTVLQDYKVRLQQYKEAINWYLEHTTMPILVVENTLTDFSSDYADYINRGRMEFLTFDGNNFDKRRGKGLGEFLIIKYGFRYSKFLKSAKQVTKITGRLQFNNINQLEAVSKDSNVVYANQTLVDGHCLSYSNFFIAPTPFIRNYFLLGEDKLDDSKVYYFEHLLFDATVRWIKDGGKASPFFLPVKVDGISGSSGKAYASPKLPYLRALVRYIMARMGLYHLMIRKTP